jgi:hypothetical protein
MEEKDYLHMKMGIFDNTLKFAFTNITEEPFDIVWDGAIVTTVKAGVSVELPHYLASKCTKELVDKIMIGNAKLNELDFYTKNPNMMPNTYRASSSLAVPAARKVWEDQICHLMAVDEESPQVQIMRAQIKEELLRDLNAETANGSPLDGAPTSLTDFADLTEGKEIAPKKSKVTVKEIK